MASNRSISHLFFHGPTFGVILGVLIFGVFLLLGSLTDIPTNLETAVMDLHFNLKQSLVRESRQEDVFSEKRSRRISRDIILVAIDNRSLNSFGRWPFPRSSHADLLNAFTRIEDQSDRESVILLDILFNDVADRAFEDVIFLDSIRENGRVALQAQLFGSSLSSDREDAFNRRLHTLIGNWGELKNISGDTLGVGRYYGIESPLIPYGKAISAYGHASYREDFDKIFRRQQLVSCYSEKLAEIPIGELTMDDDLGVGPNGHLGWVTGEGVIEPVQLPLTPESFAELQKRIIREGVPRIEDDGTPMWYVSVYRDYYIPAITLTLALRYFNRTLGDVEVEFGSHIRIPSPMQWNPDSSEWEPYALPSPGRGDSEPLDEIRIPIDRDGNMLINYMGRRSSADRGGIQTYTVRSYAAYAEARRSADRSSWPKTNNLGGKIIMVGAFTYGMADDEKPTPLGLMFGVEMHANALNTIIMDNFIRRPPEWVNYLTMGILVLFIAFLTAKMRSLGWAVVILTAFVAGSFLGVTLLFEYRNLMIDWAAPVLAVLVTFIVVVIYRVLTAERDKKQIKNVFGQFISPAVVDELSESPPELGGEDVDVTVFFSDIRGFSRISERLSAQELVKLLNDYLTDMTNNLVNDFNGTLDKYIGDAIMAFWGAPRPQKDHAVRACKCAVMQIRLLDQLNRRLQKETGGRAQNLEIGIGLNSGECMVGYMGSEGRKNYTAMGDTVNLASRLEGVNKTYQTHILISEDTWERVKHEPFIVRELDEIRVKGRFKPVTIYELVEYDGELIPGETGV